MNELITKRVVSIIVILMIAMLLCNSCIVHSPQITKVRQHNSSLLIELRHGEHRNIVFSRISLVQSTAQSDEEISSVQVVCSRECDDWWHECEIDISNIEFSETETYEICLYGFRTTDIESGRWKEKNIDSRYLIISEGKVIGSD